MSELTGEYRFRNEGDLLVLQVCVFNEGAAFGELQLTKDVWRDAKIEDLLNVQFNKIQGPLFPGIGPATCGNCHTEK